MLSSEWASLALPGVSAAVGLLVSPLPGSPPWAPGDASGGPPGNHSNVPARSGSPECEVGRQVHLANWFQGTGIGQKVNGQLVRLRLCSPSRRLSPPKRTALPSSPVFSAPQWGEKDRACQNQGSVFTSSVSFQTREKITQNQKAKRRTSLKQLRGEEADPTLLPTIPGVYRNPFISTLGV